MKILLFGKNGQVGWELQRSLAPLGELVALDFNSQEYCGDLTDHQGLIQTVRAIAPDIIVNAAAHTAVDKAESEEALARSINGLAPGVLAEEAKRLNAWLIHYSTDYVFDGGGGSPWQETDQPNPLNVYGKTKLEGEQAICEVDGLHFIFRTSWVYAARGNNFIKTMLRLAQEREQLTVIYDQIGAPTGAELLADVTAHAIVAGRNHSDLRGLYHLTAGGETSWHQYACFVIEAARAAGLPVKVAADAISPVPTSAFPTPATRPKNSRLNTEKLQNSLNLSLPHWQTGVTHMLTEIIEKQS
jgi:dTDP-4-dehydrorhamnose reductase